MIKFLFLKSSLYMQSLFEGLNHLALKYEFYLLNLGQ